MNIDVQESIFRYILPPSVFVGALLLLNRDEVVRFIETYDRSNSIFLSVILFLAVGFTINTVGVLVTRLFDRILKSPWQTPEGELASWQNMLSTHAESKIERRWNFYTVNINTFLALVLSLAIDHWLIARSSAVVIGLALVFLILAVSSYRDVWVFVKSDSTPHANPPRHRALESSRTVP